MKTIQLKNGLVATVDDDDFELIAAYPWISHRANQRRENFYAVCTTPLADGRRHTTYMHRMIVGAGPGEYVDHADGNGLNNTRANIRLCSTRSLNNANRETPANRSGYRGVWLHQEKGRPPRWRAGLSVNHRMQYLGYFKTREDAARAYDAAALEAFGAFARLNFAGQA